MMILMLAFAQKKSVLTELSFILKRLVPFLDSDWLVAVVYETITHTLNQFISKPGALFLSTVP